MSATTGLEVWCFEESLGKPDAIRLDGVPRLSQIGGAHQEPSQSSGLKRAIFGRTSKRILTVPILSEKQNWPNVGPPWSSFGTTCKVRHCQQKKRGTRVLSALAERVVYAESPIRGSVGVEGRGSAPPEERRSVKIRDPPSLRMARIPISRAGSRA